MSLALQRLLAENTTQRFHIEYEGFLFNHMSHGLLVLEWLGASADQLEGFARWYGTKLQKPEDSTEYSTEAGNVPSIADLLGAAKSYYRLVAYFQDLLKSQYGGNVETFVASEFPKLSDGIMGSALHGLIHLGFGLASKCDWFVCEALAYLHHSFLPLGFSPEAPSLKDLGRGEMDILDVFDLIAADKDLQDFMHAEEKKLTEVKFSGFERYIFVLISHKSDELAKYVNLIKFPDFFNPGCVDKTQVNRLSKWLINSALVVFCLASRRNDFFLLHGVTSSWSLSNVLPLLSDTDVIQTTRCFLCCILATYLAEKAPHLDRSKLKSIETETKTPTWDELVGRALAFRGATFADGRVEDEHVYKLVLICREMSQANSDPQMEGIYKMAAESITSFPLEFE